MALAPPPPPTSSLSRGSTGHSKDPVCWIPPPPPRHPLFPVDARLLLPLVPSYTDHPPPPPSTPFSRPKSVGYQPPPPLSLPQRPTFPLRCNSQSPCPFPALAPPLLLSCRLHRALPPPLAAPLLPPAPPITPGNSSRQLALFPTPSGPCSPGDFPGAGLSSLLLQGVSPEGLPGAALLTLSFMRVARGISAPCAGSNFHLLRIVSVQWDFPGAGSLSLLPLTGRSSPRGLPGAWLLLTPLPSGVSPGGLPGAGLSSSPSRRLSPGRNSFLALCYSFPLLSWAMSPGRDSPAAGSLPFSFGRVAMDSLRRWLSSLLLSRQCRRGTPRRWLSLPLLQAYNIKWRVSLNGVDHSPLRWLFFPTLSWRNSPGWDFPDALWSSSSLLTSVDTACRQRDSPALALLPSPSGVSPLGRNSPRRWISSLSFQASSPGGELPGAGSLTPSPFVGRCRQGDSPALGLSSLSFGSCRPEGLPAAGLLLPHILQSYDQPGKTYPTAARLSSHSPLTTCRQRGLPRRWLFFTHLLSTGQLVRQRVLPAAGYSSLILTGRVRQGVLPSLTGSLSLSFGQRDRQGTPPALALLPLFLRDNILVSPGGLPALASLTLPLLRACRQGTLPGDWLSSLLLRVVYASG
ncbi:hypothetical protein C7M84_000548 [Penaeus vannamei]|uniref:Uncharacterized protein n=1 Tax=Penaeus vannamei TaxID=6689 RepID=A0A423TWC9_PENVA|nr:hypothetical protein C7M84_000548 [Penaeus vannamei]